jgi:hypothetical protein
MKLAATVAHSLQVDLRFELRPRRDRMAIAFQQYIQGRLVDEGPPAQIFGGARTERARASVGRLLRH